MRQNPFNLKTREPSPSWIRLHASTRPVPARRRTGVASKAGSKQTARQSPFNLRRLTWSDKEMNGVAVTYDARYAEYMLECE